MIRTGSVPKKILALHGNRTYFIDIDTSDVEIQRL
jgi:hypothetical protein